VLRAMLDRDYLQKVAGLTPEQREEAMLAAAAAAAGLPQDAELGRILEALQHKDPNLKVRDAAGTALRSRAAPQAER
jgi:anthranilate phosphoribosyltransferase